MTNRGSHYSLDVPFAVPFVHRLRFTHDVFGKDQQVLADVLEPTADQPARVQFWMDANLGESQPQLRHRIRAFADNHAQIQRIGNIQVVPGGEEIKNDIHILERMLKVFNVANLDRRSYVVVIGGGAVLDCVGFAAAIAHRGLRLVRLPTTTLGQGDSGIGVKNGVNLFQKKNWLGAFASPWAVINDATLLETLSDRDYICGFSEAVKVFLLKNRSAFENLAAVASRIRQRDARAAMPVIRQSAEFHLRHITEGGDPFEMDEARPLDFGHWSAHKLESMTDFELRHGEAVAIGVAIDTVYSSLKLGLPWEDSTKVLQCLTDLGFNLYHPALHDRENLFRGLEEFRQHLGGRLTLTMVPEVGSAEDIHEVDDAAMHAAIERVCDFAQSSESVSPTP